MRTANLVPLQLVLTIFDTAARGGAHGPEGIAIDEGGAGRAGDRPEPSAADGAAHAGRDRRGPPRLPDGRSSLVAAVGRLRGGVDGQPAHGAAGPVYGGARARGRRRRGVRLRGPA